MLAFKFETVSQLTDRLRSFPSSSLSFLLFVPLHYPPSTHSNNTTDSWRPRAGPDTGGVCESGFSQRPPERMGNGKKGLKGLLCSRPSGPLYRPPRRDPGPSIRGQGSVLVASGLLSVTGHPFPTVSAPVMLCYWH